MILIPSNRKWSQNNSGEVFGMLHGTKNINFDKEGYAQLAKRAVALIYGGTNFGIPISVSYFKNAGTSGYYCITDDRPMRVLLDGTANSIYDGTYAPGGLINNDGLVWQGYWYITQSTFFARHTGSAWTAASYGSLTASVPHPLCVWENYNYLAVGNGNTVLIYNTSHTPVTTVQLPTNYEVKWIRYNHQRIYIGTKELSGGNAVMFVCSDATATSAEDAWPVSANWLFSGVAYKSSIVVMTSRGQLLRFNGGGWDELGNLPVYYSNYNWWNGAEGFTGLGRMCQRGMTTDGNIIYLNIDGYVGDANVYLDNQPSGLWVYDPNIGLYHKAGFSNDKFQTISISQASTNTTTDVFTAGATYTAQTGVKVFYIGTAGGLKSFSYYYLIRVDATTFKLASSYANAIAGTQIDITSTGSAGQTLYYSDELDTGASFMTNLAIGAVSLVSELDGTSIAGTSGFGYMSASQVLFGGLILNNTISGSVYTLQSLSVSYNRGYLTSQKIFSNNLKDSWKKIIAKCTRLFQTSDKAIIKYRVVDKAYYPLLVSLSADLAVWVNGTSFTSTANLSGVVAGEEVEFLSGRAAGLTAHVVSITVLTGTYTVTLDETIPGVSASDKSMFAIQNWKKVGTLLSTDPDSLYDKVLPEQGSKKWIQLKVELRGHSEPIIEELQVINGTNEPSK